MSTEEMRPAPRAVTAVVAASALWLAAAAFARDCSLTSVGIVPLNDLGPGTYVAGYVGGLYPNGTSVRPAAHEASGLAIVQSYVTPRNAAGTVDAAGSIGMISIGMSNTSQEFDGGGHAFKPRADADPTKNQRLVIVNGAQGGKPASAWVDPNASVWSVLDQRLATAGITSAQVQVAWIKQAEAGPSSLGPFPAHAQALQDDLDAIVHNLRAKYPHLRVCYLSSRTRAYIDVTMALNPEPYAYESAFAVRGLIEKQLGGDASLDFDPETGVVPWLSWGPYLWADGEVPRSDGFQWFCADTEGDFTHPSISGETKVASMLLAFFKTDPTTTPWFLRADAPGSAPALAAGADVTSGAAPLVVHFNASAQDADGVVTEYAWTFDDGCFSFDQNPVKVFTAPGVYDVPVVASDDAGDTARNVVTITVTGGPPVAPTIIGPASIANATIGQPFSATFLASGTTPITWSVVGGSPPPGLALSPLGVYSGVPATAGDYAFTVQATNAVGDDTAPFTHTVAVVTGPTEVAPNADAYVRDGAQSATNFGGEPILFVRSSANPGNAIAYLRFDVSGVPGPCTAARLRVRLAGLSPAGSLPIKLFAVTDDAWTETGITWNTRPAPAQQLDVVSVSALGDYTFDATAFTQAEMAGDGVVTLCLLDDSNAQRIAQFSSRETSDPPALEIDCDATCAAAAATEYGAGFPGTLGVPGLASSAPVIGASVTVTLGNSVGTTTNALLFLGFSAVDVPGFWGGSLLAAPDAAIALPVVPVAGLPLAGTIPNVTALCGTKVYLQALEVDAGAAAGASSTRGLELRLGS